MKIIVEKLAATEIAALQFRTASHVGKTGITTPIKIEWGRYR